jgi:hypothetical protein
LKKIQKISRELSGNFFGEAFFPQSVAVGSFEGFVPDSLGPRTGCAIGQDRNMTGYFAIQKSISIQSDILKCKFCRLNPSTLYVELQLEALVQVALAVLRLTLFVRHGYAVDSDYPHTASQTQA